MIPIALPSIRNIRDLGQTKTADGHAIRPNCLIRSAHLGEASPEDLNRLREDHRLRAVIDLRTERERLEQPDHTEGLEYLPLPVIENLSAGITHEKNAEDEEFPDMAYLYRRMMSKPGNQVGFRRALHTIFTWDYSAGAVLWHCTVGKDRCGMTAALVLEALGVSREAILADYLVSNQVSRLRAQQRYEQLLPIRGERFARSVYRAYLADERYIRAAWDAMGDHYLTDTLGIPQAEIDAFRNAVLVD